MATSLTDAASFDVSLVLACYCEEPHLHASVEKIVCYLSATVLKYELIFVEDCSPDGTRVVLADVERTLAARDIPFRTIWHERNEGRGKSVQDGMMAARGRIVGFVDTDLEHPIDNLLAVILEMEAENFDLICGRRIWVSETVSPLRFLAHRTYKAIVKIALALPCQDTEAGFKFFRRERILRVLPMMTSKKWFWDTEIVHRSFENGLKCGDFPITFQKQPNKKSTVKVFSDSLQYLRELWGYKREVQRTRHTLARNSLEVRQ